MNLVEILNKIIPYNSLGMNLINVSDDSLSMTISLDKNINDKNTLFAGSIYSVIVLCGWALVYKTLNKDAKLYEIVIKQSKIDYLLPVKTDALAVAQINGDIIEKKNKNISIPVIVELKDAKDRICAEFTGEYIGVNIKR